jgi:glycosyltransferase involved in cell wall biosynthesis
MTSSPALAASPDSSTQRVVHLAVGRFSPTIGGPYQTLMAYRNVLEQYQHTRLVAICEDRECPQFDSGKDTFVGTGWRGWPKLFVYSWRTRSEDVLVFGVWHPVFFVMSLVRLVSGERCSGRRALVPTQSLSKWDWAKHRRTKSLLRPVVKVALRQFDIVIFATEGERETSVPTLASEKTVVIYHPIEPVDTSAQAQTSPAGPRIVFVGRLDPQKDLQLLLRTVALLPSCWSVDIVGSGDETYLAQLLQDAERLGCLDRLRWHGWLSRPETYSIIAGADVLLVTSHAENYSHAAVEAMALQVPVMMVDRVAAATDLRRNGTGIVAPANPESLAAAILDLQADVGSSRRAIVDRARDFARARETGSDAARLFEAVTGRAA